MSTKDADDTRRALRRTSASRECRDAARGGGGGGGPEKTMKLPGKSLWSKSTPNRSNYEQSLFLQRQAVI